MTLENFIKLFNYGKSVENFEEKSRDLKIDFSESDLITNFYNLLDLYLAESFSELELDYFYDTVFGDGGFNSFELEEDIEDLYEQLTNPNE